VNIPLIIGIVVVVVVLLLAVLSIRGRNSSVVEDRLGRYADFQQLPRIEGEDRKVTKKEKESALSKRMNASLEKSSFGARYKTELARADLNLTIAEFAALHVITAIGLGFVCYFVLFTGQFVMAILGAAVGMFIPRFYVSFKKSQRLRKFEEQMPDLLSLWVNSLRSGYSTMQSLDAIARESGDPSGPEFKRVIMEVQIGLPQETALAHLLDRMPSEDLDLIITAVNIQREVGGNLAEILETIGHTIRERIKLKGEIRVLTAQGRITGYLISFLPIALGLFLNAVNPNYVGRLFSDRFCGWPMIALALIMIGLGTAIIQRIVDIEI